MRRGAVLRNRRVCHPSTDREMQLQDVGAERKPAVDRNFRGDRDTERVRRGRKFGFLEVLFSTLASMHAAMNEAEQKLRGQQ